MPDQAPLEQQSKIGLHMIPNIIHKIWFGDLPEVYKESILNWKKINHKYEVKLWCSFSILTNNQKRDLIQFCNASAIILCNVDDELFNKYPNIDIVRAWLKIPDDKVGKNRFAAASDILRVGILEEEGGHYSDTDIDALDPFDLDMSFDSGNYQIIDGVRDDTKDKLLWLDIEGYLYSYCVMGSTPQHEINILANSYNRFIHNAIFNLLLKEIEKEGPKISIDVLAMHMTGLAISASAAMLGITPHIIKYTKDNSYSYRYDWRQGLKKFPKIVHGEFAKYIHVRFDNSYYDNGEFISLQYIINLCKEKWKEVTTIEKTNYLKSQELTRIEQNSNPIFLLRPVGKVNFNKLKLTAVDPAVHEVATNENNGMSNNGNSYKISLSG